LGVGLKSVLGSEEGGGGGGGKMWPTPLVDNLTSREYFFLIGIPRVGSKEMGMARERLREWVEEIGGRERERKGEWELEGRVVSRKVVSEGGFEVYGAEGSGGEVAEIELKGEGEVDGKREGEEKGSRKSRKEKKDVFPAAGGFKKVKGSNPAEVRRQFLEHTMKASSSSSTPSEQTTGKLRSGKEVLNRMKFDEKYDIGEFVVGYIDRKEGILERSVEEWEGFGREELMAYVKNTKSGEIVWDKARRVDLVSGGKRGG
jgi:uncharacterized protein (UPF0248 family)